MCLIGEWHIDLLISEESARFFSSYLNINKLEAFSGKEFKSLNHFPLLHSGGHMYGSSFNANIMGVKHKIVWKMGK